MTLSRQFSGYQNHAKQSSQPFVSVGKHYNNNNNNNNKNN